MRSFKVSAILLLAVIFAPYLARPAAAQWGWFDNDHHHHDQQGHRIDDQGHHIDNHGHHTNRGIYDNDGDYHYQQPTYRYQTNYPQTYAPSNVLPRPADPAHSGEPIKIICPAGIGGTVNYALNTYQFKMSAGQTHTIGADRAWTISFGRGGNFGTAKYSLTPGTYAFKVTDQGWELQKQTAMAAPQLEAPAPPAPTASVAQ